MLSHLVESRLLRYTLNEYFRMMSSIFSIIQIILAVILIVVVLLQQKGSGLGAAFGGSGTVYTTRRGVDKVLFQATIVISILFFLIALINLVV